MLKFVAALLAIAALLAGVFFLLAEGRFMEWPTYFFLILAYVFFSTLIIYFLLYRVKQPDVFVQLYLLTMAVKLLGGVIFILLVVLKNKNGAMPNTIFFLLSYIFFTAVEVAFLYKRNSENQGPS